MVWEVECKSEINLGAGVFIQRAGANSSKVCVRAGVYGQGAGVHRQNQKLCYSERFWSLTFWTLWTQN